MIKIDSIKKGIVIDHIKPGCGHTIFKDLGLHKVDYTVVLIRNIPSEKMGRKDLIKIENEIDLDMTMLGLLDPGLTVNIVENGKITDKIKIKLPEKIRGILRCKNPRCVSTLEHIPDIEFTLADRENKVYTCEYCDSPVQA